MRVLTLEEAYLVSGGQLKSSVDSIGSGKDDPKKGSKGGGGGGLKAGDFTKAPTNNKGRFDFTTTREIGFAIEASIPRFLPTTLRGVSGEGTLDAGAVITDKDSNNNNIPDSFEKSNSGIIFK